MKTGLIMEGGAMRGMFTAGVTDVMMENGITFSGAIGVSAGAAFGCNYKSNQPGRAIRYNMRFSKDPRYCSFRSLLKTGDMFGADFCYREIPDELDLYDYDEFERNPMEFYAVVTDVITGEPVYKKLNSCRGDEMKWLRASASMPLASKIVEVDGYKLLDGGIADSVPVKYFESIGYEKNVVILTQPEGYVKGENKLIPLMKLVMGKYPKLIETLKNRHKVYNDTLAYINKREKEGALLVIRPEEKLSIKRVEHDPEVLKKVYELGRSEGEKRLSDIIKFIK